MPKMKTKKSAQKRYSLTATGKVKFKKKGLRHILTKKNRKRKRRLRHADYAGKAVQKDIRKLLPYG